MKFARPSCVRSIPGPLYSARPILAVLGLAVLTASACTQPEPLPIEGPVARKEAGKDYDRALPPGQLALRKITDPRMLPNYALAYQSARDPVLRQAIENSLHYLAKPSSKRYFPYGEISHEQAVASLTEFLRVADECASAEQFNQVMRERFDTYQSVGCDDRGTMLFTGYYCPIFEGSLTRTERFRYPLYAKPPDLKINTSDPDGKPVGGPWHTREEIERGGLLSGYELVWLGDKFECYVVTVQGSGKIRLPDGTLYEIGYAANNGHEYTSVGKELIRDGKIPKENLSLDTLIAYFKQNPQDADPYLNRNQRYVFFQPASGGPFGCLAEPVLPLCSIATDKEVFPRACLSLLGTDLTLHPGGSRQKYMGFACDQDRGAAIRAAGRCDIFRGTGDEAGKMAGQTYSEGKLYYPFLKPQYLSGGATDGYAARQ